MKSFRILFSVLFVMSFGMSACDDGGGKKTTAEICNDAKDNDGDGRVDCYDTDCANDAACATNNVNNPEICNNSIDDDGDTLVDCLDTVDCATATNCQATQENCTNGQDDDGDGAIDCNDTDCATAPNCQTGSCNMDNIFSDSPQTCDTGFICGINEQMQPTCLAEALFAGGTFYGDCGANGECPKGSGCFSGDGGATSMCMPFCTATHEDCPTGGACIYGVGAANPDLNLCGPTDGCDPVLNTGCTEPEACYVAGQDGVCGTAGTVPTGGNCGSAACAPTNVCAGSSAADATCYKLCKTDGSVTCETGSCASQTWLPTGVGICG
ncbi:hypothetical protein KKC22_04880 [Myxococcota bacterium]|nr:hypothetical protein [Myxococcota bacterium]